ncbi:hypothetical protein SUGI_0289640 [Cryptomeria japonica]|nr:hypothetical protein SUGI_0289640 [Cryptomeria japonica]
MEVQDAEKPKEELKVLANTAASPEESNLSIQEPSQGQQFESHPDPEGFNKDSGRKPDPEGSNQDSGSKSEPEGFIKDSGRKPYPEGFNQNSGSKPDPEGFSKDSNPTPEPEGFNQDLGHKSTTHREFEIEYDLYKTNEAVLKELKDLESSTPTPRISTSTTNKGKSSRGKKGWAMATAQKMCNCAATSAADCAAVCCCPCVLAHLLVLALVKLPSVLAIKAFRYTKRTAQISKKKKTDAGEDHEDDGSIKKIQSYKSGWSLSVTPHFSGPLEGSPARTVEERKAESQKFWQDLYAGGHLGFGGPALERDRS